MLLFFDLEATGIFDPKCITEICAINASEAAGPGATPPVFTTLVKGEVRVESGATLVNGIDDGVVEGRGVLEAVMVANLLHWVWQQASSLGGAVPVWIAHNGKR